MKKHALLVLLCICVVFSVEAVQAKDQALTLSKDKTSFSITHKGKVRTGIVYIPKKLDPKKPISLLFGLHGMNSKAADFRLYACLEKYADRLNFVIMYPNAVDGLWEPENGSNGPNDDIGLFRRLITEGLSLFGADKKRVYVTGHSMGGFMTYRIGNELSDLVTAIAVVSGTFVTRADQLQTSTTRPIGVLQIHNVDDNIVPLAGFQGYSVSVLESYNYWKKINKVAGETKTEVNGVQYQKSKSAQAPLASIVYPSGQHSWRSEVAGEIFNFFYNYPSRGTKIGFDASALPKLVNSAIEIKVSPKIESSAGTIKSLSLVSGGSVVAGSNTPPFVLSFSPKLMQNYSLELIATLTDGSQVLSTDIWGLTAVPESIAKNALASSTSNESDSLGASNVLDQNFETRWSSEAKDDQALTIDLGKAQMVKAVTIFWEAATPQSYSIEGSLDGKTWKSITRIAECKGGVEILQFKETNLRYVRIQGENRSTPWGISIWEVFVH